MNETYHKPHFGNPGTRPAAPGQLATRFALAQLPKHQSQYTVTIEKAHHTFPVRKEKLHDLFPGSGGDEVVAGPELAHFPLLSK